MKSNDVIGFLGHISGILKTIKSHKQVINTDENGNGLGPEKARMRLAVCSIATGMSCHC
jgi:hypothetical protein